MSHIMLLMSNVFAIANYVQVNVVIQNTQEEEIYPVV